MNVLQFPLVRSTVFFVSGIVLAQAFKPQLNWILIAVLPFFLLLVISYFASKKPRSNPLFFEISSWPLSLLAGALTLACAIETRHPDHYLHQMPGEKLVARVVMITEEKLKTTAHFERYAVRLLQVGKRKTRGRALLNIPITKAVPIEIGSQIGAEGTLYKNKKPKNPNQFNYGDYLEKQQIYGQLYCRGKLKIYPGFKKSLANYAGRLRGRITTTLEKNHFGRNELAVLSALVLGQQQDISPDIVRDYQFAGAIHILSVSGLHVGLVLLFVTFLLRPFPNTRKFAFVKLLIVIASLWAFGLLAGLAPSVVRSVTMFSFVALGMFLRRSVNIYHTLFISILLILICRPSFLFDVGFQLSYLALFFIVWLQPLLKRSWQPKNKAVRYFWDILTVSFAAQLGTLPLSIYYFHQFPGLFFVTNLIVLPMLGVIMALGVLAMSMAALALAWMPLLKCLEWSVWLLNEFIGWVASFESFVLRDIPLNAPMMLSGYLALIALIGWALRPNFKKALLGMSALIAFQCVALFTFYQNQKRGEFIVFNSKGKSLIVQKNGNRAVVYHSTPKVNPAVQSYLVANFCVPEKKRPLSAFYYFKGKKIFLMDSTAACKGIGRPDVVLLTGSPKINLQRFLRDHQPGQVVADASNLKSYARRWKSTCRKEKIPFHDTSEKGFYRLN